MGGKKKWGECSAAVLNFTALKHHQWHRNLSQSIEEPDLGIFRTFRQFDLFQQAFLFERLYLQLSAKVCILPGFWMEKSGNISLFYKFIYKYKTFQCAEIKSKNFNYLKWHQYIWGKKSTSKKREKNQCLKNKRERFSKTKSRKSFGLQSWIEDDKHVKKKLGDWQVEFEENIKKQKMRPSMTA